MVLLFLLVIDGNSFLVYFYEYQLFKDFKTTFFSCVFFAHLSCWSKRRNFIVVYEYFMQKVFLDTSFSVCCIYTTRRVCGPLSPPNSQGFRHLFIYLFILCYFFPLLLVIMFFFSYFCEQWRDEFYCSSQFNKLL